VRINEITAVWPSAFQASRTARWASNGGTAAPGSNEHTIALQVDHLFGFRDRELDRIVSVLMRISPNEAVLFHAVRGVSLDDPSGLILTICSVGGRPDAVALVFDGRCDRRVGSLISRLVARRLHAALTSRTFVNAQNSGHRIRHCVGRRNGHDFQKTHLLLVPHK
jgi:hypothetical protein